MHTTIHIAAKDRFHSHLHMFLTWYAIERPKAIAHQYCRYASAFGESFSLIFLLKTLIAPYKNIKDEYPRRGFNLEAILQTLTLNITARVIGMIFRTVAIVFGIVTQVLLISMFMLYFLVWIFFPLAALGGIAFILFD